jgi:hypothetical protein
MLEFLTSLFEAGPGAAPQNATEAALERAIDKTDRRLRALGDYRKRLLGPTERALRHVADLVQALPEPVEISPARYGQDARLRAVFASAEHLGDVLGQFQTIRDFLENHAGPLRDEIFGLLTMLKKERRILGMEMDGDQVQRDVLQTAVTFEDHRFIAPSTSEAAARDLLATVGFDYLLEKALGVIVAQKSRRGELVLQRQLLRRKLLSPTSNPSEATDFAALEAEIAQIDEELGEFSGIELSLDESLKLLASVLNEADQWLAASSFETGLDYRNIVSAASEAIELSELSSLNGGRRTVLFGWIPRSQLPEPKDPLKLGQAYLG